MGDNIRKLTALKIVSGILFLGITIRLTIGLVDAISGLALAFYFAIIVVIFGTIGNGLALIFALIGLIYTLAKREKGQSIGQVITFAILTALPIMSQLFFVLYCVLQ